MFTAALDTCVLWPSMQRDFLLSLAVEGMYRPTWSSVAMEELEYHEARKLQRRQGMRTSQADGRAAALIAQMRPHFGDAEIFGFEALEGTFDLPDPDDEHVVAAAVLAGAGVIVTSNIKDFPGDRIPAGLLGTEIRAAQRQGDIDDGADPEQLAALLLAVLRGIEAVGKAGLGPRTVTGIAETALAALPRPGGLS
ncbi:hypothetical protein J2S43_008094 [Catenuloplanes nepalensis]|uniref:PIN domain-containing protein n=1 Tax=Catenuloplanes nepalensis TaxID=587533 RepID=A0ABT9N7A7_9ACTN|nr:PIN domain-containing protein [Catenuloplanes nepalensis]MDP9799582.1 hypothetical protein [Catenuloplanes nepalensis]